MSKDTLNVSFTIQEIGNFFSKVFIDPITECWNWKGEKVGDYGRFRYRGRKECTHRLTYAWLKEPLPRGLGGKIQVIDHLICNNKSCCNPDHLRLVSHRENVLRSPGPTTTNYLKKYCIRGHLLPTKPNDKQLKKRYCKKCTSILGRKYYLAKKHD